MASPSLLTVASIIFIALIIIPNYISRDDQFVVESRVIAKHEDRDHHEVVGTRWAVLIAGSKGYENYRHQADICHAYQILKKGGVKDENIIVFMYDDIAMNPENPRPGIIINRPNGADVYKGVPKDYIKEEASLNNLFAVLLNNKSGLTGGSGKVLNSGPDDHVFIYYTDHGGPGIVGMPTDEDLYAKDLINALKKLHATKSYKKMVIYMEACESGSMFDGLLPEGLNIYATTAAKPNENSYATYCPYDPHNPPPKEYDTCLGDLYSVSWLEDSDKDDLEKESLEEQYRVVKKRTTSSHVMQYGDIELDKDMLVSYIGSNNNRTSYDQYHLHPAPLARSYQKIPSAGTVDQRDADIIYFKRKVATSAEGSKQKLEARKSLDEILAHRKHVDQSIEAIGKQLFGVGEQTKVVMSNIRPRGRPLVDDWDCYKSLISTYTQYCGPLKNYGLKYARGFANMCNAGISRDQVATAAAYACVRPPP